MKATNFVKQVIQLALIAAFFSACNRNPGKSHPTKLLGFCDTCCLRHLANFTDTLNIDTSKDFQEYFSEKKFSLRNCQLKKFRGSYSLKSSLVLFWLKIDNVYLKHKWNYAYSQDIAGQSPAIRQLVSEFYFLSTGKDPKWIEFLSPAWTNELIEKDKSLLKNIQIKKLYEGNKILKKKLKT